MCAYSLREANARRVTRSSRPAVELLPERHSAPLPVVGLAPLATAGVLQALHDPSNPPGVRLPQRVGCVVHVVSLASQLLGPGSACLEGLRGGQFFGKSFGNNERAHIDRPRSSRGVSRFAHLRWAGEEVMPNPISSSACISSSRSSSAVGHVAARSRLGEVVWVRRVAEPARYARARRGGEGGREPPPGQIHRAWQSHRAVGLVDASAGATYRAASRR